MMYEDDLSPNIPDSLYTQWFQLSEIVDGVRMGPEVRFSDLRGWYIESEAAAAELARREQAGPTPGPLSPEEEEATLSDVQIIQRRDAEVERLRGLLAKMVALVDHLLALNSDDLTRAGLEPVDTLTPANHATIEAAKEKTKC